MTSYSEEEIKRNIKFLEDGEVELITIPVAILRQIAPNIVSKQINKEYLNRPDIKEKTRIYNRKYMIKYNQRPEVKEKQREYSSRPEVKEKQREYSSRPEVKEKLRESNRKYYKKHREEILQKKKEKRKTTFKNIANQE